MNFRFPTALLLLFLAQIGFAAEGLPEAQTPAFIPNAGQWSSQVLYRMDFGYSSLFFEQNALHYQIVDGPEEHGHSDEKGKKSGLTDLEAHIFRIEFEGANPSHTVESKGRSSFYYNYYWGNDRSKWVSDVRAVDEIRYSELYKGIDLRYYQKEARLKYDLLLYPQADPSNIRMMVKGIDELKIKNGRLYLKHHFGSIIEERPYAYQLINGEKVEVECAFKLLEGEAEGFGFEVTGNYDRSLPLVIDPLVVFSTYSGSGSTNFGMTATYDGTGNGYMGGTVFTNNYNSTTLGYQRNYGGGTADIAISKFSRDGSQMLFSTFLGGSEAEAVSSMVVNSRQELIILGISSSINYPITNGAYKTIKTISQAVDMSRYLQDYISGNDIVISRFSQNGRQLLSSTFYGGNASDGLNYDIVNPRSFNSELVYNYGDHFRGEITVDANDTIYIGTSTHSSNLDTSVTIFSGLQDGVVAKFSPDLRDLIWQRYIGGPQYDAIYSLKVTDRNQILIGGGTKSYSNFPVIFGAHQLIANGGQSEGFVSLMDRNGNLLHSTYLGTSGYDQIYFVESDRDNSFYALGQTDNANFPIFNTSIADTTAGQFIVKFDSTLSTLDFSHTFGDGRGNGTINMSPTAFLVDRCKNIYVSGWGGSLSSTGDGPKVMTQNMPLSPDANDNTTDFNDFYLYVVNNFLDSLIYGSYLGGGASEDHVDGGTSRFSKNGIIFQSICASCGAASDFPTTAGSAFPSKGAPIGICNNALYKFDFGILPIANFSTDTTSFCLKPGQTVNITITDESERANRIFWDFYGNVVQGGFIDTTITISSPGQYTITQIVEDTVCATDAFQSQTIFAFPDNIELDARRDTLICYDDSLTLDANDNGNANLFDWSTDPFFNNILATTTTSTYRVKLQAGVDTFYVRAGNSVSQACEKIDTMIVEYIPVNYQSSISADTICENGSIQLSANFVNVDLFIWNFGVGDPDSSSTSPQVQYSIPGNYNVQLIVDNFACASRDTVNYPLNVLANDIVLDTLPDTLICRADSVRLAQFANGSLKYYLWSSDSTYTDTLNNYPSDNELFVNQAGIDTFYVKVSNDYCQRVDEVEVEIVPFELELGNVPDSVCTPFNQTLNTTIIGADSFRIFYGNGNTTITNPNPTISFNDPGAFEIQLLGYNDKCLIADTLSDSLRVFQGVEILGINDTVICIEDTIELDIRHNGTASQFIWSTKGDFSGPLNPPTDSNITYPATNGSSRLFYKAINGICEADSSLQLEVNEVTLDLDDFFSICLEDTIGIPATATSNYPPITYSWSPNSEILSGQGTSTILVSPPVNTKYLLTVTDNLQCQDTNSSIVEVNIPRFIDAEILSDTDTIYKGQSVRLYTNRQGNDLVYQWEPSAYLDDPFSSSPLATPPVSTTFTLTITDQQTGCDVFASKRIGVFEINCAEPNIFIPSAFTPNNDGNNDILFIRGEVIREIEFSVYNRWGERVFMSEDQNRGWNGMVNGKEADPGVFVYHLKAVCFDGQEYFTKGNVTLIR